MHRRFACAALFALSGHALAQVGAHAQLPKAAAPEVWVATSHFLGAGSLVRLHGEPPGVAEEIALPDEIDRLRAFGDDIFALSSQGGTITRVRRGKGAPAEVWDFGPGSAPRDVLVVGGEAVVSLGGSTALRRVDLATGDVETWTDLAPLAAKEEALELGTLARDGDRLFVQVKLDASPALADPPPTDRGVLGVVGLGRGRLLDVDPGVPGVQGVALEGAPPGGKMQVLGRELFVSTATAVLDGRGGIEVVDLDGLVSLGLVLSEEVIADLGGFVMTGPEAGWFVFHTDLLASSHLKPFTVAGGPSAEPEVIVIFDVVDALAWDAVRGKVYLPSGFGSAPGVWVADVAGEVISGFYPTGLPARDVVVVE